MLFNGILAFALVVHVHVHWLGRLDLAEVLSGSAGQFFGSLKLLLLSGFPDAGQLLPTLLIGQLACLLDSLPFS
jgi:hypothetical protein